MPQIDITGFNVPAQEIRESAGLVRLSDTMQRREEMNYRREKDAETDQWRKLNLIQDLTDLSKHQTGSDVANAAGNHLMTDVFQKYTQNADKMSPMELQAKVQKEMSGIIGGMEGTKNELLMADAQVKELKKLYPELDTGTLYDHVRKDIVSRRLKDDSTGFKNEMEVPQSQIDFNNPDFLSRYVTGNKNLAENIINPKGVEDTSVFTGTPDAYTKFNAKIPFWKKPNFEQAALKEGFMKGDGEPALELKSTTIPSDAIPSSSGKPFEVIDKDVYDRFAQDGKLNLELIAATREKFPTYDNFNPTEKEYAKRNVLHGQIKALDQSNFHPVENRRPARTSTSNTFNVGGGGDALINKVYERINSKVDSELSKGFTGTRFNALANDEQEVVRKAVENAGYEVGEGGRNVFLKKDNEGKLKIYKVADEGKLVAKPEHEIATLSYTGTNLPKQANVKGKIQTVQKGESGEAITKPPVNKPKTVKQNGVIYTLNEKTGQYE